MSQQSILDILSKYPKRWFSVKELTHILGLSESSVSTNIYKLRKTTFIKYKYIRTDEGYHRSVVQIK